MAGGYTQELTHNILSLLMTVGRAESRRIKTGGNGTGVEVIEAGGVTEERVEGRLLHSHDCAAPERHYLDYFCGIQLRLHLVAAMCSAC